MPGLRRLFDPRPDPEDDARLRRAQGEHRLHLRHRLLGPPALLHEHVRLPHHPRPRADARHRTQGRQARADGVGHHRRRRRAVDRRQPRPALDAPQRRHQAGHVQQPDLRPDQGPGIADVRARQEDQVVAGGHGRLPRSSRCRSRSPPRPASSRDRSTPTPSTSRRRSIAPASTRARPSSRSSRTATSSTTARSASSPSARCATTGCSSSSTASR